ncbi:MAG: 6-hydroxymethylpterin diphosphokinase MptE-like protein [Candidatus Helarchaeota archaeon]
MDWEHWKKYYSEIISSFGFDMQKDFEAALFLNEYLSKKSKVENIIFLNQLIRNRIVFVYGCGPSLPKHLHILTSSLVDFEDYTHIAADGATSALLEIDIVPDIIITDLDGNIENLIRANKQGAVVVVHAHGDNLGLMKQYVPKFSGRLLGSTQNKPLDYVKNYGGFTDGDRCVFLALEYSAKVIILVGFDFGTIIGKFSKPYLTRDEAANPIKVKKLQWAQYLISEVSFLTNTQIIRIDNRKEKIGRVSNYSIAELLQFLKKSKKK